jgi:uncharacterized protein DUF6416
MARVTFEVPDKLLGEFYTAVGVVLKRGQDRVDAPPAEEQKLRDWVPTSGDYLYAEERQAVWRRFSPRAQALFSLLIDTAGEIMTGDEIAQRLDIPNGKHGVAGIVAWPARHCAEMGFNPPFRYDPDGGGYWMDEATASLFAEVRNARSGPNQIQS